MVTGHRESARTVPGRHATAIGPSGNWAATRNSRAARRMVIAEIASATRGIASANSGDRGPRRDFAGDRGATKPWQKRDDRSGGNSRPPRDGNFDRPRFDKPRYDKPRDDRDGGERPRFSRPRQDRPEGDRPHLGRRDDRAQFDRPRETRNALVQEIRAMRAAPRTALPTPAATMRTTARYLPNALRLGDVAPIASAIRKSAVRRGRRRSKNPASASPRWCRELD